jgi:hypothetical protein
MAYTSELSTVVAQAIAETAAWCSLKKPLSHDLRSPEINLSTALEPRYWSEAQGSIEAWIQAKRENYRDAVLELNQRRSGLLREMNVSISAEYERIQTQGRLLLYFPMETVLDGAAEACSRKFFDVEDAPPWDTWFCYSSGAILSWVPESMIARAQAGIDANPVDCIHWAAW